MREYDVARVWGIPIRVHVSLLVILPILAYLIGSGEQIGAYAGIIEGLADVTVDEEALGAGNTPWLVGSLAAVGLFVSVALHELGHSWMAMRYDLEVESITLWILGGLANLGSIPREWNKEFWIAIAGPAVSVLVGLVCYGALLVVPESVPVAVFVVGWLAVTNLVLAVFNMLPAFPMDGGRVLRAVMARNMSYVSATRAAARIGTGFAILFFVTGLLVAFSPMLLLLALFIYAAANGESRAVVLSELLSEITVGDLASDADATIDGDATVDELVTRMFADSRTEYAVTENGTVIGVVSAAEFTALPPAERDTTTVRSIANTDLPRFDARLGAFEAFAELGRTGASEGFVDSPTGTRVVTQQDFAKAMEMRRLVGAGEPF